MSSKKLMYSKNRELIINFQLLISFFVDWLRDFLGAVSLIAGSTVSFVAGLPVCCTGCLMTFVLKIEIVRVKVLMYV